MEAGSQTVESESTRMTEEIPLHVILWEPEIPPNTGNIIRLCANTGSALHLIEPLGFEFDDARLRRAGLDYREFADVQIWPDLDAYRGAHPERRIIAIETTGLNSYGAFRFAPGDALLFGSETRGLSAEILATLPADVVLRLPMMPGSRSLNLSNAAAVVVYEAWRQLGFYGAV
jgi:tRNA (cytidine/uridine-2'-O-)-methyltransferase